MSKKTTITLADEIDYLEMCTQIELAKRDDVKIEFRKHLKGQIMHAQMPSLFWQPLIENTIKYCSGNFQIIDVDFYIKDGYLLGSIKNSAVSEDRSFSKEAGSANGIRLVKERVALLNKINGKGTAVEITDTLPPYHQIALTP